MRPFQSLKHRFGHCNFKVGKDDEGYTVRLQLATFLKYLNDTDDDSPLYIFDSRFAKEKVGQ